MDDELDDTLLVWYAFLPAADFFGLCSDLTNLIPFCSADNGRPRLLRREDRCQLVWPVDVDGVVVVAAAAAAAVATETVDCEGDGSEVLLFSSAGRLRVEEDKGLAELPVLPVLVLPVSILKLAFEERLGEDEDPKKAPLDPWVPPPDPRDFLGDPGSPNTDFEM